MVEQSGTGDESSPADLLAEAALLRGVAGRELQLIQLLRTAGTAAHRCFEWDLAIASLEEAAALQANLSETSALTCEIYFELAEVLNDFEEKTRAEQVLRVAVFMAEKRFGFEDPQTAVALEKLAMFLLANFGQVEIDGAVEEEVMVGRALQINEASYGPDHPVVAATLRNLAALLKDRHAEKAERLIRRALTIDESVFGPNHPAVAADRLILAQALYYVRLDLRDTSIAEARRALEIDEQCLGPDHPTVAKDLLVLADLIGSHAGSEAEEHLRRALAIAEQAYGAGHLRTLPFLGTLALHLQGKRNDEAVQLRKQELQYTESTFGPCHPRVAMVLLSLKDALTQSDRRVEAEPVVRRVLAIQEQCYGEVSPEVADALVQITMVLWGLNRLPEAETLVRRTLAIELAHYGPDSPEYSFRLAFLARVLVWLGRLTEAETLLRQALAIDEVQHDGHEVFLAGHLHELGMLLGQMKRFEEADALLQRSLEIMFRLRDSVYGEHPNTSRVQIEYEDLLIAMGYSQPEIEAKIQAVKSAALREE